MNDEIKNLIKYIKHNGIKSSDEIVGFIIRASKNNKLNYNYRFGSGKDYNYKYLGYLTKKQYRLLKKKNVFKYISKNNSSYASSYNYIFRVSDHWGNFENSKNNFYIDILEKSKYKNNYGMTEDFENNKIFLVGAYRRRA